MLFDCLSNPSFFVLYSHNFIPVQKKFTKSLKETMIMCTSEARNWEAMKTGLFSKETLES